MRENGKHGWLGRLLIMLHEPKIKRENFMTNPANPDSWKVSVGTSDVSVGSEPNIHTVSFSPAEKVGISFAAIAIRLSIAFLGIATAFYGVKSLINSSLDYISNLKEPTPISSPTALFSAKFDIPKPTNTPTPGSLEMEIVPNP